MLELPDVTLVALYNGCHELTLMAVNDCCRHVKFGAVKLFTDKPTEMPGAEVVTTVSHPDDANHSALARYAYYELPKHIETSHILSIHWDSWVIDPAMWTPEFLAYDYVGAPWWYKDGLNVGNSGFCLRSKKLLDFLASHEEQFPIIPPEDDTLCRRYRPALERHGFRWPPDLLAHQFAFEWTRATPSSFGFHGFFNWPFVLTVDQIEERIVKADPYVFSKVEYRQMLQIMSRMRRQTA